MRTGKEYCDEDEVGDEVEDGFLPGQMQ